MSWTLIRRSLWEWKATCGGSAPISTKALCSSGGMAILTADIPRLWTRMVSLTPALQSGPATSTRRITMTEASLMWATSGRPRKGRECIITAARKIPATTAQLSGLISILTFPVNNRAVCSSRCLKAFPNMLWRNLSSTEPYSPATSITGTECSTGGRVWSHAICSGQTMVSRISCLPGSGGWKLTAAFLFPVQFSQGSGI